MRNIDEYLKEIEENSAFSDTRANVNADLENFLQQIRSAAAVNNLVAASALCQQALALGFEHEDLFAIGGECALALNDYKAALVCFRKAAHQSPDSFSYTFHLGIALEHEGQFSQAQITFEKSLCLQPNRIDIHCRLGRCLFAEGDFARAVEQFDRGKADQDSQYVVDFVCALLGASEYERALQIARPNIHLLSNTHPAQEFLVESFGSAALKAAERGQFSYVYTIAELMIALRAHSQAEVLLRFLLETQSDNADGAAIQLARLLHDLNRNEEGRELLRAVIRLQTEDREGRLLRALIYCQSLDEAQAELDRWLLQPPPSAEPLDALAHALKTAGLADAAIGVYHRALRRYPEWSLARIAYGAFLIDCDWIGEASNELAAVWKQLSQEHSPDQLSFVKLGENFERIGLLSSAYVVYQRSSRVAEPDAALEQLISRTRPSSLPLVRPAYETMDGVAVTNPHQGTLIFLASPDSGPDQQVEFLENYLAHTFTGRVAIVGDHPTREMLGARASDRQSPLFRRIVCVGDHPAIPATGKSYSSTHPFMESVEFNDLLPGRSQDIQSIILLCNTASLMRHLRVLAHLVHFDGRVIIPSTHDLEWPTLAFENPKPILEYVFPCAGTMRFAPCFDDLLARMNWQSNFTYFPFVTNGYVIQAARRPDGSLDLPTFEEATEAIYWRARALEPLHCMRIHEYIHPIRFKNFDGSLVVLLRDPRDIINSMFWLTRQEAEGGDEAHILRVINGYVRVQPHDLNYAVRWPSADLLVNGFVDIAAMDNAFVIRFEDMHAGEASALKNLLMKLGLDPNPFLRLTDEIYQAAAYLGTFEYQTGGKRKRNENYKTQFGLGGGATIRKGSVGDWRSSFTPAAVKRFKELTGDGLVRLGYENDLLWDL